jgi:hypothetical protein
MRDLALQSFVSVAAIRLFESREDRTDEERRQLEAVQAALEAAGIYFEGDSTATKRFRMTCNPGCNPAYISYCSAWAVSLSGCSGNRTRPTTRLFHWSTSLVSPAPVD